ncbi:DUF3592 domain-containing protein [Pseudonocardia endophytica]|uniref:DUF3592 domain-containing protein n=1 Tax=Pseudonocardia endophytica TaxID=401976 RepID=A0A4V2PHD3_PSEEN|nr:DUF3592 domain-containing protein [Pseudonocardia endophytica]TCK20226.1 hypothetical protein EV378_4177 [Pseudonocardia endophytica]
MTSPAGDVLAESRTLALRILRAGARKLPEIVAWIAVVLSVLTVLALAGAVMNDVRISSHRATTAATVLEARTVVQFTDGQGQLRTPSVLYPSGLSAGDNIYVEYDATQPDRVRVAGRSWIDGLLPTAIGLVVIWAVFGPLVVWLRRRRSTADAARD